MVLLTVRTRTHGPVTQIVAIYRAHGRSATQWLITTRLTSVGLMFLTTTKVLDKDQYFNIAYIDMYDMRLTD